MIIQYNKPNFFHVNCVAGEKMLNPGANEVDYDWWQVAKEHPTIKIKLDNGVIEEISEGKSLEQDILSLKELKQNVAKDVVSKTIDLNILKEWLKVETRPFMKGAIKKQIELIEAPITPREGSSKVKGITTGQVNHVELSATPNSSDI